MKQTIAMMILMFIGTFGAFVSPFYGVVIYYVFSVMRPQYIWVWALPPDVRWSLYVAIATIVAALMNIGQAEESDRPAGTPRPGLFSRTHFWMLLFSVWVTLTYVMAQNRLVAWPWYVEYLKIFLMFFVSALLVRTLRQVWVLFIVTALAIGYIAYEVNFLYLSVGYMGIYHNGYGGLDNNGAGLMLAIAVPMCIFIYMGTSRWWRWAFASLIPVLLHAVLMTYSRGAMVALLVASPIIFLRGKNKFQLTLAAVAIFSIIPILAGREIRERFFTLRTYQEEGSAQARFASWNAAYHIALDYPVFGVGVRNANLYSQAYGADMEGRTIHSQFLQVLADNGFPGFFIYVALVGLTVLSLRRVRRWAKNRDDEEARLAYTIPCGIEGALAVFCIGSLFLSLEVFELPYVLLLLGAQLPQVLQAQGLMTSDATPSRPAAPPLSPPRFTPPAQRPAAARPSNA